MACVRQGEKSTEMAKAGTMPRSETPTLEEDSAKASFRQTLSELSRSDRLLLITTSIIFFFAEYMAYIYSPPEETLGDKVRIIYLHIPSAWISYLAFGITFISSLLYLKKKSEYYDLLSVASVELGVLFCTIALITGSLFSKVTWGAYWNWDPRQTTTLILWFSYAAYLALRFATSDPERRAHVSAVLGILLFPTVPLSYLSTRIYWSLHPMLARPGGLAMVPKMGYTLFVAVVAITLLFIYLLHLTLRTERAEINLKLIKYGELP